MALIARRSLRGSVDWNAITTPSKSFWFCRSLRGSVDWNRSDSGKGESWIVAPFAGAWIEIYTYVNINNGGTTSLPSRERGLKLTIRILVAVIHQVAPFAGAWIEIGNIGVTTSQQMVAPFAGAWIEIRLERWQDLGFFVAPFAGAWIEISFAEWEHQIERGLKFPNLISILVAKSSLPSRERGLKFFLSVFNSLSYCRSLRGSVDWNFSRYPPLDA